MPRRFDVVGVVGLGTMGAGIVEVFARAGLRVIAVDVDDEAVARGRAHLERSMDRAVRKGRLDETAVADLRGRVDYTTSLARLAEAGLVVEAVPERVELKARVFAELDRLCPPETILASNTSSLSITEIGARTGRPGRVVGMHFFNPAPVLRLVEVVRSVVTEAEVVRDVQALAGGVGHIPVVVGDRAGFIANGLLFGYLNQAAAMYEQGHATREDLDAAMRLGLGYPMGPLALLDLIGLDTAHEICETMYAWTHDRRHAPTPLLRQLVTAGMLGRKSGRGFYTYERPGSSVVIPDASTPRADRTVTTRPIRRVGVVGTDTTTTGIAELFATSGHDVVLYTRTEDAAAFALITIARSLDQAVAEGAMSEQDREVALGRIVPAVGFSVLAECDLVVVAVAEDPDAGRAVMAALDEVCGPGAILATITSSSVIELAAATSRAQDVVGLRVHGTARASRLIEIIGTVATAPEVIDTVRALCPKLGGHPVLAPDRAGFIVDALLFPYLNDAVRMLESHYADADDIDTAMTAGCGLPTGPIELLDTIGPATALAVQRRLLQETREPGMAPAPLLTRLVTAGRSVREGVRARH